MNEYKITSPPLYGVVERNSHFWIIDRALQKRIVWISASAGYGKTTLTASYLKRYSGRFLWYNMDETDVDAATFFQYLSVAVKTLLGKDNDAFPEFNREYVYSVPTFAGKYFKKLFAEIMKASNIPCRHGIRSERPSFIIVFDNYQDVPAASPLHGIISKELALIPGGVAAIIISREEPPIEYTNLRVNGEINFIGWDDLVFSVEETSELVKNYVGAQKPRLIFRGDKSRS